MAVATDDFTGDNGSSLGANWTQIDAGWSRDAGKGKIVTTLEGIECWNESVNNFGDNQYSQVVIDTVGGDYVGVGVRIKASSGTGDGYFFYSDSAAAYIASQVNGTRTNHQTALAPFTSTDLVKIEVSGQVVKCFVDGVQHGSDQDMSAVGLTGGQPGLFAYGISATAIVDSWEGGDLAVGGTVPPLMFHRRQQGIA
jgi:hypothetical protein